MEREVLFPGVMVWHNSIECDDEFIQKLWAERYLRERGEKWEGRQNPERLKHYEEDRLPLRVAQAPNGVDLVEGDPCDDFVAKLDEVYLECIFEYAMTYPCLVNDLQWREAHRLLCYVPRSSMSPHSDNTPGVTRGGMNSMVDPVASTRLVVCLTFLNDCVEEGDPGPYEYAGGEVYLPYVDVTYSPKKGATLMYPANFLYAHGVLPVLEGNRIANLTVFNQGDFTKLPVLPEDPPRRPWLGGNMFIEFQTDDQPGQPPKGFVRAIQKKTFPCQPSHF